MNLIPFVSSLIIALALFSALLFQKTGSFEQETRDYHASFAAMRDLQGNVLKSLHKKSSTEEQKGKGERGPFVWHREKKVGFAVSTLSLHTTIKGDIASEKLLRKLLEQEYPMHRRAVPALILHIKKVGKKARHITDLLPKEGPLKEVFLEMLRGNREGKFPRLDSIVSLDDREPIVWAHASPALLRAAFGVETTREIEQKERERFENNKPGQSAYLLKSELKELLETKGGWDEIKPLIKTGTYKHSEERLTGKADGVIVEKIVEKRRSGHGNSGGLKR